jgi:hypothetical protein
MRLLYSRKVQGRAVAAEQDVFSKAVFEAEGHGAFHVSVDIQGALMLGGRTISILCHADYIFLITGRSLSWEPFRERIAYF